MSLLKVVSNKNSFYLPDIPTYHYTKKTHTNNTGILFTVYTFINIHTRTVNILVYLNLGQTVNQTGKTNKLTNITTNRHTDRQASGSRRVGRRGVRE